MAKESAKKELRHVRHKNEMQELELHHAKTRTDMQTLALRRASTRNAIRAQRRGYDGAKTGRHVDGWVTASIDSDAEIAKASGRVRDRARDLVRNNPFAAKAVMVHASYMVGSGITPNPKGETEELDSQVTNAWNDFAENCDVDGRTTFYGIQNLMVRSMVESGECLLQFVRKPSTFQPSLPLQLRVLECDHIDSTRDKNLPGGGFIQNGIEFDSFGTRVAYWLFPRHPGSARMGGSMQSIRVVANDIVHLFDRARPGQNRGVSWFAPVMLRMRDLDDYDLSELIRKKMESSVTALVTGAPAPDSTGGETDAEGRKIEGLEPGMVQYLEPGEDIRFTQPVSVSGYAEYVSVLNHAVAAGLGIPYELMTGDLSKISFSSVRAGFLAFRRLMSSKQNLLLIPQLCQPVWKQFLPAAQVSGLVGKGVIRLQWTPPIFESVDPVKDMMAQILAVRAGSMSPQTAIAQNGYDLDVIMAEFQAYYKMVDDANAVFNFDARKTTDNGLAKLETPNAPTAP
ncbi:MAG: phage portal protein [Magnetococcales bacterium]|nr:phage portal protein [Magnetococcales bacterium]